MIRQEHPETGDRCDQEVSDDRDLVDNGTWLDDLIDPEDPEPVTAWEKLLRQAGLVERRRFAVQTPIVETFVCRVRGESSLPAEVVEADQSYR